MYKNNKTSVIGIVVTIIILIILVILTNINVNKLSGAENLFSKLVMPIQNGLTHLKNKIAKNDSFFENINKLDEENEKLKERNLFITKAANYIAFEFEDEVYKATAKWDEDTFKMKVENY